MLMKWKEEQGKSATYKGLIKALEVEKLNDLVESVKSLALQEWTESQRQSYTTAVIILIMTDN